ncbi:MAG: thrombospondin type 3 repeat-containing protein, partial [Nitrosopumilaceae archaeon]
MRKKILLGFLLLLTTTIGSIPAYSDNGVSDKDNDSIPDNVDYCPNLPEDFEDEVDGCPSEHEIYHDQDQDGIQDHDDLCPNVPEIYNHYQ